MIVDNLGIAAYLKINGFGVNRKIGPRHFEFEIDACDEENFRALKIDYINTPYARFDNELMMLRRMDVS